MSTFSIAYRTGGPVHCQWRRVSEAYAKRDDAILRADEIERMGYRAEVYLTRELDEIGLPIGWEPSSVDWWRDECTVSTVFTEHRVRR